MAQAARFIRKCSACEADCQCGCQSNLCSLPLEVLEHILWYEDAITLTILERTSKYLFIVVSNFWMKYCKQKELTRNPTPLCLGWNGVEDEFYSYDKAVELSFEEKQRWRIMAVRDFLRKNRQCVVCRATCNNVSQAEQFTYGDDVLLCFRCVPHFTITITHDLFHAFDEIGILTSKLHVSFGTILLSQFVKILRSNSQNENDVLTRLRSLARPSIQSPIAMRRSRLLQLAIPIASDQHAYLPGRCCCSVRQCSAAREQVPVCRRMSRDRTRERPFYIVLGVIIFLNLFEFVHASIIMKHFEMINIVQGQTAHFIMVAFVEMSLLICCTCYLPINWYRRLKRTSWNQSFATILQCFILVCFLVEINESILTKSYAKNYKPSLEKFFEKEMNNFTEGAKFSSKLDWIPIQYECCLHPDETEETDHNNDHNPNRTASLLTSSSFRCCLPNEKFCSHSKTFQSCSLVIGNKLTLLLESFAWTNIICCLSRIFSLIYICYIFHAYKSYNMTANSASVQSIFTIS